MQQYKQGDAVRVRPEVDSELAGRIGEITTYVSPGAELIDITIDEEGYRVPKDWLQKVPWPIKVAGNLLYRLSQKG